MVLEDRLLVPTAADRAAHTALGSCPYRNVEHSYLRLCRPPQSDGNFRRAARGFCAVNGNENAEFFVRVFKQVVPDS